MLKTKAHVAAMALIVLGLSSCASHNAEVTAAPPGGLDLSQVCPPTVVVQTDWNPEAEHGHLYQTLGPNPVIDANKKSVSGDLYTHGQPTGIRIEIRAGGPAIGFQSVTSQMYSDKSIYLGYVSTDEAIQHSNDQPTTAVFAQFEKGPSMIMWDPSTYPNVTTIKDLGNALAATGGVVRYFEGSGTWMNYLIGAGQLPNSATDGSYDGTPGAFVAAGGKDAQQGFASAEPYIYQHDVSAWNKQVKYQLIHDTGYPTYTAAISVRTNDVDQMRPCLTKLVPVLQQAAVDYSHSPSATNQLIVRLVHEYNNGWVYSNEIATYASHTMAELGLTSNGPDGYAGEMTPARIQRIIDITTPIFTQQGTGPKPGLVPKDIATNEFLDTAIRY